MRCFFMEFAIGIGILVSFAGWGWLIAKALRLQFATGMGSNAAIGLALTSPVGAILNWFHLISPGGVRVYILIGIGIAAFSAGLRRQALRDSAVSAWDYFRPRKLMSVALLLLI